MKLWRRKEQHWTSERNTALMHCSVLKPVNKRFWKETAIFKWKQFGHKRPASGRSLTREDVLLQLLALKRIECWHTSATRPPGIWGMWRRFARSMECPTCKRTSLQEWRRPALGSKSLQVETGQIEPFLGWQTCSLNPPKDVAVQGLVRNEEFQSLTVPSRKVMMFEFCSFSGWFVWQELHVIETIWYT